MNCQCKIGVSLPIFGIFIACISWGQLYKNLHLRFQRAVTIVGTTLIKIWIHPQIFINYIFCVLIQKITQSVPIMVSCLGNLWLQYQYHTNCYNILVFLSYDLWIYCQYFHTHLLLFCTEWCFLQHQSVIWASGNHFINKNS